MEDALLELVGAIKDLAPQVWAIYLKQVSLKAIIDGVSAVLLIIASILSYKSVKYGMKMKEEDYTDPWEYWVIFGWVGMTVFTFAAIVNVFYAISYLYNPEYYAIDLLLQNLH